MKSRKILGLAASAVFTLFLAACGGGGSDGSTAHYQVTGTVAYGHPVAGQTIQALDSAGRICARALTTSDGQYSMNTSGCAPGAAAVYVNGYTTPSGAPLDAVAMPPQGMPVIDGVVNINPLTTLLAYYAAGSIATSKAPANNDQVLALLPQVTAAQYQQAKSTVLIAPLLQILQTVYGVSTTGFDPTTAPFVANGQGVDGFFDAYPLTATATSVQVAAPSSSGPLVRVTLPTTIGSSPAVTSTSVYTISGNLSGLASGSLSLLMNGANPFSVTANGPFTFPTAVSSSFVVTVGTQPTGQICTVSNGSGSGVTANVSNVSITCSTNTYTIGGMVTGLATGTQVTLHNNSADPATVTANNTFTFATPVAYNGSYAVTVGTQPTGQTCTVSNGSGSGVTANVSNVSITCSTNTYTIGGTVTGLATGTQVTLHNNSADPATVTANSTFTFATPVAYNGSYAVTVGTQPTGQTCTVSNGSGSGVAANVSTVSVACAANPIFFYVGNYGSNNVLGYRFNPATGATTGIPGSPFAAGTYDRWITVNPAGTFAYATNQNSNNVSAYSIHPTTGALTPVPGSPFAAGSTPVSVTVNAAGTFAYVANANSGDVSVYSINLASGALTPVPGSPFAAGSNPGVIAINATGTFAYVSNPSGYVLAYSIDPTTGALTPVPGSPFATASPGGVTSVTVNAAGTFAYTANGWGSVSAFSIDPTSGALTTVPGSPFTSTGGGGQWVEINPAGTFAYLATGNGGPVLTFRIDPTSGALTQISGGLCAAHPGVPGANYIKINSAGTLAYVANGWVLNVSVCSIDPMSGALTDVPGSPFSVGARPLGIGVVQH